MTLWYGCGMDEGILAIETTRTKVVEALTIYSGGRVCARHTYGRGDYEYRIGYDNEDHSSYFVIRQDRLHTAGFDPNNLSDYLKNRLEGEK